MNRKFSSRPSSCAKPTQSSPFSFYLQATEQHVRLKGTELACSDWWPSYSRALVCGFQTDPGIWQLETALLVRITVQRPVPPALPAPPSFDSCVGLRTQSSFPAAHGARRETWQAASQGQEGRPAEARGRPEGQEVLQSLQLAPGDAASPSASSSMLVTCSWSRAVLAESHTRG